MIHRFRRNGARSWLFRVLGALLLVLLIGGALVATVAFGGAGPSREPADLLTGFTPLGLALNLAIGAAFLAGLLLVLLWLRRAAREESAIWRFFSDNEASLAQGPSGRGAWRLDRVEGSAIGERVQLLEELARVGARADTSALAEALLDREDPRVQVARYSAGTLVLLGLLGTFVGLLLTIGGVAEVVDSLGVSPDGDLEAFMVQLKVGLRSPLEGMSLAFSTSLLGLASSLVLGIGALGLSAAQSSWISKLEEITALYLAPAGAASAESVRAAPAEAVLRQAETAAHLLRGAEAASRSNLDRIDGAASRMASAVDDFRERVAAMAAQVERVETLLARLADAQGGHRETLNDLAVKLAEQTGALTGLRSDVRDGGEALDRRLQSAVERLREGLAEALTALSHQDLQRQEEAREVVALLARLAAPGSGSLPGRP